MDADPKLRAYYRLAQAADDEALDRVREAIAARRRELAAAEHASTLFTDLPPPPPEPPRWTPPDPADFRPDPR